MLCFAVGQIVYGPISDHVGRKPVLLAALALYVAVCLGCAFATSIEMLIALRCLQALGVAGAPVLARAIVRDLYQGARAGRELVAHGRDHGAGADGRALARRRAADGVRLARELPRDGRVRPLRDLLVMRLLAGNDEARAKRADLAVIRSSGGYGTFLRHRGYRIYLAIVAASYGGLFAWISGSSFVLQDLYGLSPLLFGLVFAAATLGYGAGTLLAARLVVRIGIDRTIVWGGVALAAGGLAMLAAVVRRAATSPLALAAADGALSLRPRPRHAAGDGGRAHAVSRSRRRRLLAARLPAAGRGIGDRHRGRADARRERAAARRDHRGAWAHWRWRSHWSDARCAPSS